MKRVTFDIQVLAESSTKRVTKSINGYEVFKGLAAHRPHNRKYGWTVSHINSGYGSDEDSVQRHTITGQVMGRTDPTGRANRLDV